MSNYKRLFLNGYKYVFFTIVTHNRQPILIDNIQLLRDSFKYAKNKYVFDIFAISVLKDHIHLILKLNDITQYPKIIYQIKTYFSRHMPKNIVLSSSKLNKGEKGIWQRRYWEHTIRGEEDLFRHLDYIHYNSVKHYNIAPNDWKYSSFDKFVQNEYYECDWCNFNDLHKIKELDFE